MISVGKFCRILDWLKMKPNNLASRLSSKGSTSVEFVWGVPLRPFSWQDGKRGPEEKKFERFLTTSQVGGSDWQGTYRPFDDYKGLFISFAGLTPDEGHIADFANKYGCLLPGYDPDTRIWLLEEGSQNPISARGETREFWQREILAMSLAFKHLDWTSLRFIKTSSQYFQRNRARLPNWLSVQPVAQPQPPRGRRGGAGAGKASRSASPGTCRQPDATV
jgi:hypothetical protein